jgi:hypothetical protein
VIQLQVLLNLIHQGLAAKVELPVSKKHRKLAKYCRVWARVKELLVIKTLKEMMTLYLAISYL